jgi:hypothetical protein
MERGKKISIPISSELGNDLKGERELTTRVMADEVKQPIPPKMSRKSRKVIQL